MPVEFYKTRRWVKLRLAILRRDNYQCQRCRRYGKLTQATHVHHIMPREDFPALQWEPSNLVSLCARCHELMHDRLTGELTAEGANFARRMPVEKR